MGLEGIELRKDEKNLFDNVELNDSEKALIKYASHYRKQTKNLKPVDGPWFKGVLNIVPEDYHNKKIKNGKTKSM